MNQLVLPSGTTDADRLARVLARHLGSGVRPADGTLVAEDLRVQGQALADRRATVRRAVAQSHPGTATDLLSDLEDEYGLPNGTGLPIADRQVRLLAKYRSRADGSLAAIAITVWTILPAATLVTLASQDVAHGDPAGVFALVILLADADFFSTAKLAQLDALLIDQLTAHADITVARGDASGLRPFRCGDGASLCGIDLLGL